MRITNKNALKILFISNAIFVFAGTLLGPLYAVLAEKFDSSIISVSFSWFVFTFSATVFTILVARYGDRIKEKEYLLVLGFVIRVVSWILYIFTTNLYVFLAIQVLLGIGQAVGTPAFDSIFAKHLNRGAEISEFSDWQLVSNFSVAIASLAGGFVVYYFSFEILFILMAFLGCISIAIVLIQPRKLL